MLLVTGGWDGSGLTSVEVFSPSGVPIPCTVPPLPASRHGHTQDGLVACGGYRYANRRNCVSLTGRGWQESHQLQQRREDHSSWRSSAGLLLMGGYSNSSTSTELLSANNLSTTSSFKLTYSIW